MTELATLTELLDDGEEDRFFRIPDYQRGYSWEWHHRRDLLDDLEEMGVHGTQHFTGTIVAARPPAKGEPHVVVDGQQRLTTLILLIARLIRRLEHLEAQPALDWTQEQAWERFVQKAPDSGRNLWRLTLNGEQNDLFQRLLSEGKLDDQQFEARSKADLNLKEAVAQFDEYLESYPDPESLQRLFGNITKNIGFLFYAPEDSREIGLMFEVINNRGKPLSELEKVKNYLIYFSNRNKLPELRETTNRAWSRILSRLNDIGFTENEDEQQFLRNCWIVFEDPRKSESYWVYDGLKEKVPPDREGFGYLRDFVQFLDDATLTFQRLYQRHASVPESPEKLFLERIAYQPGRASILPLIVALFQREDDPDQRAEVLDLLEKLNFRFYVAGIAPRNDSKQGYLFRLAHDYFREHTDQDTGEVLDTQVLKQRLIRFVRNQANRKSFVKRLTLDFDESGDFYRWHGLRYFLACYEAELRGQRNQSLSFEELLGARNPEFHNDAFQREHILAKREESTQSPEDDINKRRLGNFVLVREGTNKGAGNQPVQEKIQAGYARQDTNELYQLGELEEFLEEARSFVAGTLGRERRTFKYWYQLYQKLFDVREERLVNFALRRWGVEGVPGESGRVTINSFNGGNEIFQIENASFRAE